MQNNNILPEKIYNDCIEHFNSVKSSNFVVEKSMPITYFGNVHDYHKSKIKIVTVALNPSGREFPLGNPRFCVAKGLAGPSELEEQLSNYFTHNPYIGWFNSFERVLNGLEASYGGLMNQNQSSLHYTALHLDFFSPIATNPTWSKLGIDDKNKLICFGNDLFIKIIKSLTPNVIIFSVARDTFSKVTTKFQEIGWLEEHSQSEKIFEHKYRKNGQIRRSPITVKLHKINITQNQPSHLINASASHNPFGNFTTEQKIEAGNAIKKYISGG